MHIQIFIKAHRERQRNRRQHTHFWVLPEAYLHRQACHTILTQHNTTIHNETIKESKGICIIKNINNAKENIIIRVDLPAIIIIKLLSSYLWLMNLITGLKCYDFVIKTRCVLVYCFTEVCPLSLRIFRRVFHLSRVGSESVVIPFGGEDASSIEYNEIKCLSRFWWHFHPVDPHVWITCVFAGIFPAYKSCNCSHSPQNTQPSSAHKNFIWDFVARKLLRVSSRVWDFHCLYCRWAWFKSICVFLLLWKCVHGGFSIVCVNHCTH